MTDKHLAVSLDHQVKQSREIKKLKKEVDRQSAMIVNLLNKYGECPRCGCVIYSENLDKDLDA